MSPAAWSAQSTATQGSAHSGDLLRGWKELSEQARSPRVTPEPCKCLSNPSLNEIPWLLHTNRTWNSRDGFCDVSHCVSLGRHSRRLAGAPQPMGALHHSLPFPPFGSTALWKSSLDMMSHIQHLKLLSSLGFGWLLFLRKNLMLAILLQRKDELMLYYSETFWKPSNCRLKAVIHSINIIAFILSVTYCTPFQNLKNNICKVLYTFTKTLLQFISD